MDFYNQIHEEKNCRVISIKIKIKKINQMFTKNNV